MVREERVERRAGHGTQRARARERRRVRGSERRRVRGSERGSEHERQRVRVHERARERARSRARARARARARVKYPQMRKPDLRKRVIKKDTTVLHKRALWNTRDSPIKNTKESESEMPMNEKPSPQNRSPAKKKTRKFCVLHEGPMEYVKQPCHKHKRAL